MLKNYISYLMLICLFVTGCSEKAEYTYNEQIQLTDTYGVCVDENGSLRKFGDNSLEESGEGSNAYGEEAKYITDNVKSVHSKGFAVAVIKNDDSLWIYGCDEKGLIGNSAHGETEFVKVLENVKTADIGYNHAAAILTDGSLYTWGDNAYGQLGRGNNLNSQVPVKIGEGFIDVSVSLGSTYALKENGSLWACGLNDNGQLGTGTVTNSNVLVKIMNDTKNVYSDFCTCAAIRKDNSLWIWGSSDGASWNNSSYTTVPTKRLDGVDKIGFGLAFSIVRKTDGSVWGWGNNVYGQIIEDSDMAIIQEPVKLSDEIQDFDCNAESVMIKKKNGTVLVQGKISSGVNFEYIPSLPIYQRY